jgi:hypothetical protein
MAWHISVGRNVPGWMPGADVRAGWPRPPQGGHVMDAVIEQFEDVLQNIEFGIVATYRKHREITDYEVMRVLEAAIDAYRGEKIGRPPNETDLADAEREMLDNVRGMCQWRLGRTGPPGGDEHADTPVVRPPDPITVDDALLCLKRVLKSVKWWNKENGRRGYLDYVVRYVG